MKKQVKYSEPTEYMPKEIREKYFGKDRDAGKKKSTNKTTKKK